MIDKLIEHLSALDDPRCPGTVAPRPIDILVMAVCGVSACGARWEAMALAGRSQLAWLRQGLARPNGIPSPDPFRRVFRLIDPDAFAVCLNAWVAALAIPTQLGLPAVGALDGTTRRRSFDRRRDLAARPVVRAWASAQPLGLGQRRVDGNANESTAIPE